MTILALVAAWALAFVVNLAPAFMPPTWAILAILHFTFGLPVIPLAVGGALAASAGRAALALASRRYGRHLVPAGRRAEMSRLGTWLDAKARWAAPLAVLVYSFGPIPSNQLFIAVGLTGMTVRRVATAFLAGRLVSYPLWIGAAHLAVSRLDDLFERRWHNVAAIALDVALLALLVLFVRIDWSGIIERLDPAFVRSGTARDRAHRPATS